jgi:hypothetical protein
VATPGNPASAVQISLFSPDFKLNVFATWSVPMVSIIPFFMALHKLAMSFLERKGGTTLPLILLKSTE